MALMIRILQSVPFPPALGNAGAIANAQRACEERRMTEARIDAFLSSPALSSPGTASPGTAAPYRYAAA